MDTTRNLQDGIRSIPGLYILGKPEMSVFAFGSREPELSIHQIADLMEKRQWHLDRLQSPDSIHMIITPPHESVWHDFLKISRIVPNQPVTTLGPSEMRKSGFME